MRVNKWKGSLKVFLLLILAAITSSYARSQACGQGVFTIKVYTMNASPLERMSYEIFPLNYDSLKAVYPPEKYGEHYLDRFQYNWSRGTIIPSEHATRVLDTVSETTIGWLNRGLYHTKNKKSGFLKEGVVRFGTIETYTVPYLLRLSTESESVWMVVHVFDGCDRTSIVLWDDRPQVVVRR